MSRGGKKIHHKVCMQTILAEEKPKLESQFKSRRSMSKQGSDYAPASLFRCAAFSVFPLMMWLRSPTGNVTGKSTDSSNWTRSRYQTIIVSANVSAPDACWPGVRKILHPVDVE